MRTSLPLGLLLLLAIQARAQPPVFDLHVHLHHGERSLAEYEAQAAKDRRHVERFGAMWFGGPNQALQGDPARVRESNDRLIALSAKHPALMPIATVHPYDGEAAFTELRRIAARGVKVVKIHAHTQRFDVADPRVLALTKVAGEVGVIVLMDNASILPGDCENLFNLALQAPKTTFIFAHLGGMNFRFWNILAAARTADGLFANNIYFDISAMVAIVADSPIEEEFVWTIRNVGVDHVLFGSDFPQYSLARNLDALDRLGLSEAEKSGIRFENARRLFDLPVPDRAR
jgi:predicted TIM-barrel fold metal-dependent hydrolase